MISFALATLLLSTTSTLLLEGVDAQVPVVYQPIAYAASSILADGGFYLYGGTIQFASALVGTNQFLRLDLTQSFSTATPPWTSVPGNIIYTMIDAAPSQSGQQFIIGGNRDHNGQALASAYDISTKAWITLPSTISTPDPTYKRWNVGMGLDKSTGLVVIYGGFGWMDFLQELSALDTATNTDPHDFKWDVSFNQTVIPKLYGPFVLYLPTLKQTLVIGGGSQYNASSGLLSGVASLAVGYLVSGATSQSSTVINSQTMTFAGGPTKGPAPRYQACKVVMDDGNVLIQGGRDPYVFYGDTWVLNVTTWVWTNKTVNGPSAAMTRAAHSCQMGPNGQVLIVGGFLLTGAVYSYVSPAVAVLDTKTWTWTNTYTGAPVDQIWTPGSTPPSTGGNGGDNGGNNNNNTNNTNNNGTNNTNNGNNNKSSTGLSSGAKGGIGAGVALVLVGLVGFIFWKKRAGRQQFDKTTNTATSHHYQQPPATITEKNYTGGDDLSAGSAAAGSMSNGAQHAPPMSSSSLSTAALSTLPLYATNDSSTTPGSAGPAISYATKPQPLPAGGMFGGHFVKPQQTGSKDNDEAALAAALLQAEDKTTSSPQQQSPTVYHTSPSNSQDVYSAKTGSGSPSSTAGQLNPQGLARSPALTSTSLSPPDAFPHVYSPNAPHRILLNPQSVPEHEARIERFSPGVRTHVVNDAKDLDAQGLYPPLTANRPYGFASTVIGTPADHPNSTAASSFSAAAAAAVADAANGTPTETQSHATGYFGNQQLDAYHPQPSPQQLQLQQYQPPPPQQYGAPQTSPYRDPRMMRDLDDIARMIESQTMSEPQGPHTMQTP